MTSTSTPMTAALTTRSSLRSAAKARRDASSVDRAAVGVVVPSSRRADKEKDKGKDADVGHLGGDDELVDHVEGGVRRGAGDLDGDLMNCYESVNLVRSDLIREFEARGVRLARLQKDVEELSATLAAAEEAKVMALAESARHLAAREELERQRAEHAKERTAERAELNEALEREVARSAALEAELEAAKAERAEAEKVAAATKARVEQMTAAALEADADNVGALSNEMATMKAAAAEAEAEAAAVKVQLREAHLRMATEAATRTELEQRLESTEKALADVEELIGDTEAAVLAATQRAEAAEAAAAAAAASSGTDSARVAELELELQVLRSAAAADAAEVATAKAVKARAESATTAEERAEAALARAARAEARVADTSKLQLAVEAHEAERRDWAEAVARVPGASSAADLANRVVSLERELTAAVGGAGEGAAALAAATAAAAAERRRADEADQARAAAKAAEADAVAALARMERRLDLVDREKNSIARILKSYDEEAATKGAAAGPGSQATHVRQKELEASLDAVHGRCAALEAELAAATAAAASERAAAAEQARAAADATAAAAEARTRGDALEREVSALEARVGRGEYNPAETKILHFRANPAALATASAAENELETVRGECEVLRETVSQLLAQQQQAGDTPVAAACAATPGPVAATPGGPAATPIRMSFATTPGPSIAEAELTVMRRRVADLEKREQRYMTVFKQKISTFREACYLIFGYKVDMGEDKATGQPTFTLRSMYAVREDEALVMRVEPGKVGATGAGSSGKVELLPTAYAGSTEVKMMVDTFVGRCRSVPGFIANLTMELFNKQTLA